MGWGWGLREDISLISCSVTNQTALKGLGWRGGGGGGVCKKIYHSPVVVSQTKQLRREWGWGEGGEQEDITHQLWCHKPNSTEGGGVAWGGGWGCKTRNY